MKKKNVCVCVSIYVWTYDMYIYNARPRKRDGDRECDKEGNKHRKKTAEERKKQKQLHHKQNQKKRRRQRQRQQQYPTRTCTDCHGIIPSHPALLSLSLTLLLSRSISLSVCLSVGVGVRLWFLPFSFSVLFLLFTRLSAFEHCICKCLRGLNKNSVTHSVASKRRKSIEWHSFEIDVEVAKIQISIIRKIPSAMLIDFLWAARCRSISRDLQEDEWWQRNDNFLQYTDGVCLFNKNLFHFYKCKRKIRPHYVMVTILDQ